MGHRDDQPDSPDPQPQFLCMFDKSSQSIWYTILQTMATLQMI